MQSLDIPLFMRPDGRAKDALRPVSFTPDIAPNASGSVLCAYGATQVICAATLEPKVPTWMKQQGVKGGWLTAEYSLLPYATDTRQTREVAKGKLDGRTVEIQRLIGRSLRAVLDLSRMDGYTLWIDCDVLRADGGTRTAAITGAYVAARLAVKRLLAQGKLRHDPFTDSIAAVSCGVYRGEVLLDLNYPEDKEAAVDANVVMTGSGKFVEVQCAGEEATYTPAELTAILALAAKGVTELTALQAATLAKVS